MTTAHLARDLDRAAKGQDTPQQVLASIVDGINTGNLDALMTLYEPGAAFAAQPGTLAQGLPATSWSRTRSRCCSTPACAGCFRSSARR